MKWFTSDTHFGHRNIAGPEISNWGSGYRDFHTVEEMDATIIATINEYVGVMDELWHLGDFYFSGSPRNYFERIKCKRIHLILGNHDKLKLLKRVPFASINVRAQVDVNGVRTILDHYSMRVWNGSHRGNFHLYGHSHGSIKPWGRSMDVGVDAMYKSQKQYRPISEEEVYRALIETPYKNVDHHKPEKNRR